MSNSIKVASLLAAGQAAGVISVNVAALTEGVVKAMFVTKIKAALVIVLILGFVATGTTIFASRMVAGQDNKKPTAEKPVEPAKQQEEKKEESPTKSKADDHKFDEKLRVPEDVPGNEELHKTLLALDKQLWDAAKTGDWKVADRLLAKDFVGYSALYGRIDRTANVEGVKNRRYTDGAIRDVETRQVSKDVAILTYVYSCKVTSVASGTVEEYRDHRTSSVWVKRDGAWLMVFGQDTADATATGKAGPRKPGFRPGFPNPEITSDPPPAVPEKQGAQGDQPPDAE